MDDSTILEAFRQKKTNAEEEKHFAEVCDFIYNKLFPNAKALTKGDISAAGELVWIAIEELYIRLQNNPKFAPTGNLMGYLFVIIRNKWADRFNKNSIFTDHLFQLPFNSFDVLEEIPDLLDLTMEALKKVSKECQEIIALRADKIPYEEIAITLNKTAGAARVQFFECKNKVTQIVLKNYKF